MTWIVVLRVFGIYLLVGLLAGLIAYLGNDVGRKVGRKKMSVLGLRPRHTSNFITTLTGSVIAVTTLTLFAIFSEPVRQLLTGTDKLERHARELETRSKELEKRIDYLDSLVKDKDAIVSRGRVAYGVGEPIVVATLNPSLGEQDLRGQIATAILAANLEAIHANDKIALQKGDQPLDSESHLVLCPVETVEEIVTKLRDQKEPVGLRIYASQNALYRDQVPVKLETIPIFVIFHEGETVAVRTLPAKHPQVLKVWYGFLDDMKTAALRKGMIQINDNLGGLYPDDFAQLSKELDELTGSGKLLAVAKRDLYQTSHLDVRVEVRADSAVASPSPTARVSGAFSPALTVAKPKSSLVTYRR